MVAVDYSWHSSKGTAHIRRPLFDDLRTFGIIGIVR